jgi:hypothetical protein
MDPRLDAIGGRNAFYLLGILNLDHELVGNKRYSCRLGKPTFTW